MSVSLSPSLQPEVCRALESGRSRQAPNLANSSRSTSSGFSSRSEEVIASSRGFTSERPEIGRTIPEQKLEPFHGGDMKGSSRGNYPFCTGIRRAPWRTDTRHARPRDKFGQRASGSPVFRCYPVTHPQRRTLDPPLHFLLSRLLCPGPAVSLAWARDLDRCSDTEPLPLSWAGA